MSMRSSLFFFLLNTARGLLIADCGALPAGLSTEHDTRPADR
jgi:hypothetical protein